MNTTPKFSIVHTSARPGAWRAVYEAWLKHADHPEEVEYVLVIDPRWGFGAIDSREFRNMRAQDRVVVNQGRRCYVDGVNTGAAASSGRILLVNADDQFPCPQWDSVLAGARDLIGSPEKFLLWAPTGTPTEFERGIVVMPVMSRALYEAWGYVLYPLYESMYADNDLCAHARQDGALYQLGPEYVFPHRHAYFTAGVAMDAAYEAQNRQESYAIGLDLYTRRVAARFQPVPAVGTGPETVRKHICVLLPGREWPLEFMSAWTDLLMRVLVYTRLAISPIFGSASDAAAVRSMLAEKALRDVEPKPDYVLWIDNDNVLGIAQLLLMVETLEARPEISAVAAWCWCLYPAGRISCGDLNPDSTVRPLEHTAMMAAPDHLLEVEYTGFPGLLMRLEVLEQAGKFPFRRIDCEMGYGQYGEDVSFCIRARAQGARFFVDRRLRIDHLKLGALDGIAAAAAVAIAAVPAPAAVPVPVPELVGVE